MRLHDQAPIIDEILEDWRFRLGGDFVGYRNHCYRVLNFCVALGGDAPAATERICVAAAFHDLGIWADGTFDYLGPSRRLAREYLQRCGRTGWAGEVDAMIEQHHKITRYRRDPNGLVETFRKADWIDVTRGALRFGLPAARVGELLAAFPNAGFHRRLLVLAGRRLLTHPFDVLPMMKL